MRTTSWQISIDEIANKVRKIVRDRDPLRHQLYAAPSPIHGQGCFARTAYAAGAFIGTFTGAEVDEDATQVLWFYDAETQTVQRRRGDNLLRWLNHSDQPNAVFYGFDLYALRPIIANAEITIDYSAAP
jgi:uncharacterized protein